jgi:hypothetical protein
MSSILTRTLESYSTVCIVIALPTKSAHRPHRPHSQKEYYDLFSVTK